MTVDIYTKKRLYCPGPTPVPREVAEAMSSFEGYHRGEAFCEVFKSAAMRLGNLFQSDGPAILLSSSGSGAMDAAVANLTDGDAVVVISGGKFGERWHQICEHYGCTVHPFEIPYGSSPDPEKVAAFIASTKSSSLFVQANETSTGVAFPINAIAKAVRDTSKDCLIVVDAISGFLAHPTGIKDLDIDVVVTGSQKGLGLHPGLAMIGLSSRAKLKLKASKSYYFNLSKEMKGQLEGKSAWTPASSLIAGLSRSLDMIEERGLSQIEAHHAKLADAVRKGVLAIGLELLANEFPSNALTAIKLPSSLNGSALVKRLERDYGATFAGGQGELSGKIIRFAHLGWVDRLDIIGGMAALEFALRDEGYVFTLGSGTSALMSALAS